MKVKGRILAILMSVVLVVGLCPGLAAAAPGSGAGAQAESQLGLTLAPQDGGNIAEGTWGTCPWEIDAQGTLTVHPGVGASQEGKAPWFAPSPWDAYKDSIKRIVFVTEVGKKVVAPKDSSYLLYDMNCVESIDLTGLDTSGTTSLQGAFCCRCYTLKALDLSSLDTSNVTNMYEMLGGLWGLESIDLSGLDMSSVTNASWLFSYDYALESIKLAASSPTDIGGMFAECDSLKEIDLTPMDASKATNMGLVFSGCTSLESIDLTGFDTTSATNMYGMFSGCPALSSLDLSSFSTGNVTNMSFMFCGCLSIPLLDLSSFEVQGTTALMHMFSYCSSLGTIVVGRSWAAGSDSSHTFDGCIALVGGGGTAYDDEHGGGEYARVDAKDAPGYLTDAGSLSLDLKAIPDQVYSGEEIRPSASVTDNGSTLIEGRDYELAYRNNVGIGTATVTALGKGDYEGRCGMALFRIIPAGGVAAAGLWGTCLWELDGEGILAIHPGVGGPSSLLIQHPYVTANCSCWYGIADAVKHIVFVEESGAKVIAPEYLGSLFDSFDNLETVDVCGLDTSNTANMSDMFNGCSSLRRVYADEGWSMGGVKDSWSMFGGCTSLVGGSGTAYDEGHVDGEYARIDVPGAPGYFTDASMRQSTSIPLSEIAAIPPQTYTGSPIEPAVSVTLGGRELARDTDYTVSYANNINAGTATVTVTGTGGYTGKKSATFTIEKARSSISLAAQTRTYAGKALPYTGKVTRSGSAGKVTYSYYSDSACKKAVKASSVKAAGTYWVKATLATDANHESATSKAVKFTISKAANPMKVTVATKTAKLDKVKKGNVTVAPISVMKAQGKVIYAKVDKGSAKCLTVAKATGKVTVKKGTKTGDYKIKVKVTAAGNANYKSATKTVTATVRVK